MARLTHIYHNREYARKKKEQGLCRCGKPLSDKSARYCDYHHKRTNESRKRFYYKRKKMGICVFCGEKSRENRIYCGYCAEARNAKQKGIPHVPRKLISAIADTDFSNDVKTAILLDGEYCDKELKKRGLTK